MNDREILSAIERMVEEEHQLLDETSKEEASAELHTRLAELQVSLDQSWDLLRRRRARREFGQDPATTEPRDATTVERYEQ